MTTKEEYAERRERWIEALESGRFQQAKGHLRVGDAYCCLGVACAIFADEVEIDGPWAGRIAMPLPVREYLGLANGSGAWGDESTEKHLTNLNDGSKNVDSLPFTEIAKVIRSLPEGMFIPEALP